MSHSVKSAAAKEVLARSCPKHLDCLPDWIASHQPDLKLCVGKTELPVHSFLLCLHFQVISQAVSCEEKPGYVTLTGESLDTVEDTLAYIYRRAVRAGPTTFTSVTEALHVAIFTHKHDSPTMSYEADHFLASTLQSKKSLVAPGTDSSSIGRTSSTTVGDIQLQTSWDLVDVFAFGCHCNLSCVKSQCTCRDPKFTLSQEWSDLPGLIYCLWSELAQSC